MNGKNILVGLAFFLVMVCVCPVLVSIAYFVLETIGNDTLTETLGALFLMVLCGVPLLIAFVGAGLQLREVFRAPHAARVLAEPLGLQPLNEAAKPMGVWYGGNVDGHQVAFRPHGTPYRSYTSDGSPRNSVRFSMRVVVAVDAPHLSGIVVERPTRNTAKNPQTFEEAFSAENASALSNLARVSMLEFVQKGYRKGFTKTTFRLSKGTRNLRLYDRPHTPADWVAASILPDAPALLVYSHPDSLISAEEFDVLLKELFTIASAAER